MYICVIEIKPDLKKANGKMEASRSTDVVSSFSLLFQHNGCQLFVPPLAQGPSSRVESFCRFSKKKLIITNDSANVDDKHRCKSRRRCKAVYGTCAGDDGVESAE